LSPLVIYLLSRILSIFNEFVETPNDVNILIKNVNFEKISIVLILCSIPGGGGGGAAENATEEISSILELLDKNRLPILNIL